jgi:hypothetical protein
MDMPDDFRPIHVRRFLNLRAAFAAKGWVSQREAIEALGRSQPQLSQIAGDPPSRKIGDMLASELEAQLGLPYGALDQAEGEGGVNATHPVSGKLQTASQIPPLDESILREAELWVSFEEGVSGRYQPVRRLRRLLALIDLLLADGGRLSPSHAAELVDMARNQGARDARSEEPRGGP